MSYSQIQNNEDTYTGPIPTVFKSVDVSDINVYPFNVYKQWTAYSGSHDLITPSQGIYTDINVLPIIGSELTYNDATNIDGSLQSITYFGINHLYYKRKDTPAHTFGPTNLNVSFKHLFETASIFSILQRKIGDGIKPASFNIDSKVSGSYVSDKFGNIVDSSYATGSIISNVAFYEGFNESFDVSRNMYESDGVTYISGIPTTNGQQKSLGLAAKFDGAGFISTNINGAYTRDTDYAISFFICSASAATPGLILAKASSSITPSYPFRIELVGGKIYYTVAGATHIKCLVTSSVYVTSSWTHIVCQKSGSVIQMYANNVLQGTDTSTFLSQQNNPLTLTARIDNKDPLKIGGYSTNSSNLIGSIDEVRIYNKQLTVGQRAALNDRTEGGTVLQTAHVGNIFTKQGLAVLSSADYRVNNILQCPYTASYRSTKTIYELNVLVQLNAGDFNMSSNISLTGDDDIKYLPFVTGSSFMPYITTIGLYDSNGQLLAVGKLAQAIRNRPDVDMNFLLRIDLDSKVVNNIVREI